MSIGILKKASGAHSDILERIMKASRIEATRAVGSIIEVDAECLDGRDRGECRSYRPD